MRRIAAVPLLMLAAAGADACSVRRGYERPEPLARYDNAYDAWIDTLSEELRGDPDPEIAYAGALFGRANPSRAPPPPPPPPGSPPPPAPPEPAAIDLPAPTTAFAHWLRFAYCNRSSRCADGYAEWIATEPDNAFVIVRALAPDRRGVDDVGDVDRRLRLATHYDDHQAQLRALPSKIATHYDVTPPAPPAGYTMPPCQEHYGVDFARLFTYRVSPTWNVSPPAILHDASIAIPTRLHVAELMLAATNLSFGADHAVAIGVAAAAAPADRERWCREKARLDALSATLASRYVFGDEVFDERRRRFYAALTTRNAIDAAEVVAREENTPFRAIDEAAVAACVAANDNGGDTAPHRIPAEPTTP